MAWKVERTKSFDKWWKKEKVEDQNYKFHEKALQEFQTVNVPHHVNSRIFQNSTYECWVTRLPDKARKQGKSGGFRVVLIIDIEERIIYLQGIFRRDHLDFKKSSGKYYDQYQELIKELAKEFVEI